MKTTNNEIQKLKHVLGVNQGSMTTTGVKYVEDVILYLEELRPATCCACKDEVETGTEPEKDGRYWCLACDQAGPMPSC